MKSLVILLGFFIAGCSSPSNVTVIIENGSVHMIDSVVLSTYHYKCILYRVPMGATVTKTIPRDSIQLNTHEFMLAASLYGFNLPREGVSTYWYNDLSGSPAKTYTVILTGDRKVNIISTW